MGKRGPAPKPTELRILHGDRKDRINHGEPKPRVKLPEPPIDMSDEALEIWIYTLKELSYMRVVTAADRDALVAYCEAVALHRKASRALAEGEVLIDGQRGNLVRNPAIQIQRDAASMMKSYAAEFGLTPRARSEFSISHEDGDDGIESLLS
jgi:P27 family predicted phage terminase small subunit